MRTATLALSCTTLLLMSGCCSLPSYTPSFWNDGSTIQYNNNCYNYGNNKRTDTYAQPGLRAGAQWTTTTCDAVRIAAIADGIDPLPASGTCPSGCSESDQIALVVGPGFDYHWYRRDANGMWTHKVGWSPATNLDNANNPIANPETAARGAYTDFCGYFCSCSDSTEGAGHEDIK